MQEHHQVNCCISDSIVYTVLILDPSSQAATVAAQHSTWCTLGFLRGVLFHNKSGSAFCTRPWIDLFVNNLERDLPLPKRDTDISSQPSLMAKKVKLLCSSHSVTHFCSIKGSFVAVNESHFAIMGTWSEC